MNSFLKRLTTKLPLSHVIMLVIFAMAFIWSGAFPKERLTWLLEGAPVIVGLAIIIFTYNKIRLTTFAYGWLLFCMILILIGAHYTYPDVPIGEWLNQFTGGERNNYDKIGHFFQGCCPAVIARELLLRKTNLRRGPWLWFIVICVATAISAWYEVGEWFIGAAYGGEANSFLGAQGYQWDTQSDMLLATVGAILTLVCFSRVHDGSMRKLKESLPDDQD